LLSKVVGLTRHQLKLESTAFIPDQQHTLHKSLNPRKMNY